MSLYVLVSFEIEIGSSMKSSWVTWHASNVLDVCNVGLLEMPILLQMKGGKYLFWVG